MEAVVVVGMVGVLLVIGARIDGVVNKEGRFLLDIEFDHVIIFERENGRKMF